jgi:hypothetical protein
MRETLRAMPVRGPGVDTGRGRSEGGKTMTEKKQMKVSFCCEIMAGYVRSGVVDVGYDDGFFYAEFVSEKEKVPIEFCPNCGKKVYRDKP